MGISYGPVPLRGNQGASELPQDDWMCGEAVPMWGREGRGDMRHMKLLGANAVRLYGNNPEIDHTTFLDEARFEGLDVLPGMSDHPYYQDTVGNCQQTGYDCFTQVKPLYLKNLQKGFLLTNKHYHPALRVVNILNEPDLKMPSDATNGGSEKPRQMCKAVISAFDSMLEAEKEAGVVGPLINFTATFSYAICSSCSQFSGKPALGQLAQLQDAMYHPESYGYTPRNNITAAYEARWVHSFNTQNPATDLQNQFLDQYNVAFARTPVYIGEYHRVGANQTQDLGMILDIASRNPLFQGISFFEYQVAYWKTGSEMEFGMLGLKSDVLTQMPYFGKLYDVYCLDPVMDANSGMLMADAVARVYGGSPVDTQKLCAANPWGAALRESGFTSIASQNSVSQMEAYVERLVQHLGATVNDAQALTTFAGRYAGAGGSSFPTMMSELGARPAWATFDANAKCVANRYANPETVGSAIGWACQQAGAPNCSLIPEPCQRSTYTIADYIFSRYYETLGSSADPLQHCSFGGAGIFAASPLLARWTGCPECAAGANISFATTTRVVSPTAAPTTAPPTPAPTTTAAAVAATSTTVPGASNADISTTVLRGSTTMPATTTQPVATSQQGQILETTPVLRPTEVPTSAAPGLRSGLWPLGEFALLALAASGLHRA